MRLIFLDTRLNHLHQMKDVEKRYSDLHPSEEREDLHLLLVLLKLLLHRSDIDQVTSDLDWALLQNPVCERNLVEHHLAIHHVVDWLALDIEVKQLPPLDLGVKNISNFIPRNSHGDRA